MTLFGILLLVILPINGLAAILEDVVETFKGRAVDSSVDHASVVVVKNFHQCLRLCWYSSECSDISYNSVDQKCRLFREDTRPLPGDSLVPDHEETFSTLRNVSKGSVPAVGCLARSCASDRICVPAWSGSTNTYTCPHLFQDLKGLHPSLKTTTPVPDDITTSVSDTSTDTAGTTTGALTSGTTTTETVTSPTSATDTTADVRTTADRTTDTITETATTDETTDILTTQGTTDTPTTESKTESLTTETTGLTTAGWTTDVPTTEETTEVLTSERTTDIPTTERTTDTPTSDTTSSTTRIVTTEETTEIFTTERTTGTPSTEITSEIPTSQGTTEIPTTDMASNIPTTEATTSRTTERTTGTPTTETTTQIPTTNGTTEVPTTEITTEFPTTETRETFTSDQTESATTEQTTSDLASATSDYGSSSDHSSSGPTTDNSASDSGSGWGPFYIGEAMTTSGPQNVSQPTPPYGMCNQTTAFVHGGWIDWLFPDYGIIECYDNFTFMGNLPLVECDAMNNWLYHGECIQSIWYNQVTPFSRRIYLNVTTFDEFCVLAQADTNAANFSIEFLAPNSTNSATETPDVIFCIKFDFVMSKTRLKSIVNGSSLHEIAMNETFPLSRGEWFKVGVEAVDDQTVEVDIETPSEFLYRYAVYHPPINPFTAHRVEVKGDAFLTEIEMGCIM